MMTVVDILNQAYALTVQERKELAKLLIDTLDTPPHSSPAAPETEGHWGKSLNRLMDDIGSIEMLYPEIEDPVAWVKHQRAEQRRHRLGQRAEADVLDESQ